MTASRTDADHVIDLLGPDSGVTLRRFFGGWSLIHAGRQVCIVMDTVYAKVPQANRASWRNAGSAPFQYTAKGRTVTVQAYWSVPADAVDDGALLRALVLGPAGRP